MKHLAVCSELRLAGAEESNKQTTCKVCLRKNRPLTPCSESDTETYKGSDTDTYSGSDTEIEEIRNNIAACEYPQVMNTADTYLHGNTDERSFVHLCRLVTRVEILRASDIWMTRNVQLTIYNDYVRSACDKNNVDATYIMNLAGTYISNQKTTREEYWDGNLSFFYLKRSINVTSNVQTSTKASLQNNTLQVVKVLIRFKDVSKENCDH